MSKQNQKPTVYKQLIEIGGIPLIKRSDSTIPIVPEMDAVLDYMFYKGNLVVQEVLPGREFPVECATPAIEIA